MKKFAMLGLAALVSAAQADELYSNGPVVNPLGRSVVKAPSTTLGLNDQTAAGYTVADDFTVTGAGWTVASIDFYGYQTGSPSFNFGDVTWSIVLGDVNSGSVVASGVTSVTNGGLEGYRVPGSSRRNKDRGIYDINADITDLSLAAGSYWLRWSLTGSAAYTGPWQPPTSDGRTGNAQQAGPDGSFSAVVDDGSGLTMELPFKLNGTVNAVPEPATWLTWGAGLALLATRRRRLK